MDAGDYATVGTRRGGRAAVAGGHLGGGCLCAMVAFHTVSPLLGGAQQSEEKAHPVLVSSLAAGAREEGVRGLGRARQ